MKRRLLCLILAVFVCLSAFLPLRRAKADISVSLGQITGVNVAMRKSASTSSSLIRRLDKGTIVEIIRTNVNAEWYQIKYKGDTGYVSRMYVSIEPSLEAYQTEFSGKIINCNKEINVRKTPSTSGQLMGTAPKDATYTVLQANAADGWHLIDYKGDKAYVSDRYVSLSARVPDDQLSSMTVEGGELSPNFAPGEYGYVLRADSSEVKISVTANKGVKVSVDGTGRSSKSFTMVKAGSRTIRISLDGKTRYTVYVVRDALVVGTWNIKRGNGELLRQGRVIECQQPDIMGIQEVLRNDKSVNAVDNLLSLRTKTMHYTTFAKSVSLGSNGEYGLGVLSSYKPQDTEVFKLTTPSKLEQRILLKCVYKIDGKKVSVYNTHFSYDSASIRSKQFADVLAIMNKDKNKYIILMGDFNAQASEFSKLKGYTVLNTGTTKFYDTDGSRISKSEIDNIIVNKNITVLNTRMISTRASDHRPIFAFLRLDDD